MVARVIDGDDELKNIKEKVLAYNSKNFKWINKKLDLERTMSEFGKPFQKQKSDKKNKKQKNRKSISKCR